MVEEPVDDPTLRGFHCEYRLKWVILLLHRYNLKSEILVAWRCSNDVDCCSFIKEFIGFSVSAT